MRRTLAALVAILALALPAQAQEECAPGLIHVMPFCYTPEQYEATWNPQPAPIFSGFGVERWRPWIVIYFRPEDVNRAMRVMACESSGNPNAVGRVGEVGLFQHHPRYWIERSARYGWAGWSAYSPDANIAVAAAIIYYDARSWAHWTCARR
jgi:soluble lytic murein transglycosylase-like protein